jgi:hypothetical protein
MSNKKIKDFKEIINILYNLKNIILIMIMIFLPFQIELLIWRFNFVGFL